MKDIQSFIDPLKSQLKLDLLEIHLDPLFASHVSNNRNSIRQNILNRYQEQMTTEERLAVLDLNQRPVSKNLFFSVSHMKHNGGYAVSNEKVGFDIEDISRISTDVIRRISTTAEIDLAPQIEFLWSAKESSFKVIGETKDLVFTDIRITHWMKQNDIHFFNAQMTKNENFKLSGALIKLSDNIMLSLAVLDRS